MLFLLLSCVPNGIDLGVDDLHGLHWEGDFRLHTALAAPAVDDAEVERIRQDGLGLAEEASGVLVDALVDIANVLDAEQRAELLKLADRKHH